MSTLVSLAMIIFMPVILAVASIPLRIQQFGRPDINRPREEGAQLTGVGARIVHAQKNAWEAAIMFIGTLFIVVQAGTPLAAVATVSTVFVVIRCVYVAMYLLNIGWLRFLSFLAGASTLLWMVISALSA